MVSESLPLFFLLVMWLNNLVNNSESAFYEVRLFDKMCFVSFRVGVVFVFKTEANALFWQRYTILRFVLTVEKTKSQIDSDVVWISNDESGA